MLKKYSSKIEAFVLVLQAELEKQLVGISEYDLIQALKLHGYFDFLSIPASPHELFHAHFFLFHTLYLLRDRFLENEKYVLNINTLKIQLLPYEKGEHHLQEEDKLRSYYLDINNLDTTSENDVYDMLAKFWSKFNHVDKREAALAELCLKDPIDDEIIKQKYRRLIMQHHPDRGGDTEKLQKLNDAIKILLG